MENQEILYNHIDADQVSWSYRLPEINFTHFKSLTSGFGIKQFQPGNVAGDLTAGYTLNDNAMALIVQCTRYESVRDISDIAYIKTYFDFIRHCLQPEGYFLNYVDEKGVFTKQNDSCNLADSNGKAIWALGHLISLSSILPAELSLEAEAVMKQVLFKIGTMHSKHAMAFAIKGLYYYNLEKRSDEVKMIIKGMANRLEQMYNHSAEKNWNWFEGYIEPGDCILPEALLYAYAATGETLYRDISEPSFGFLISHTFDKNNNLVHPNSKESNRNIDSTGLLHVILALKSFYLRSPDKSYLLKMQNAFNLFAAQISPNETNTDFYPDTTAFVNYLHAGLAMETCFGGKNKRQLPNENMATLPVIKRHNGA